MIFIDFVVLAIDILLGWALVTQVLLPLITGTHVFPFFCRDKRQDLEKVLEEATEDVERAEVELDISEKQRKARDLRSRGGEKAE